MIPLISFIESVRSTYSSKDKRLNFEDLRNELSKFCEYSIKEDEHVAMVYSNGFDDENSISLKSCIIDKDTCEVLATQYNKILGLVDSDKYIETYFKEDTWSKTVVTPCYDGTMITLFHHKDRWYKSTQHCLDAYKSKWSSKSYGELVDEAFEAMDVKLEDHDKKYFYVYVLQHSDNQHIISFPPGTKRMVLCAKAEKVTLIESFEEIREEKFGSLSELRAKVEDIGAEDYSTRTITNEGYILRVYKEEPHKSQFITLKLHSWIYEKLLNLKLNSSNIYQIIIDFCKSGNFNYTSYFTRDLEVANISKYAYNFMCRDLLNVYHKTRGHNYQKLYTSLPGKYKSTLYRIHGIYLEKHAVITYEDISNYLRNMDYKDFIGLFINLAPHITDEKMIQFSRLISN